MLYFIQASDGGPIKIGTTVRLTARLKALTKECGRELRVLAVVNGNLKEEKSLHRKFSHLRVFREWFEPGDDLLGFIVQTGQEWDGSDEVPLCPKSPIASFKGTKRFAAWFEGLTAHVRLPASVLIEHALIDYAAKHGYGDPPPER